MRKATGLVIAFLMFAALVGIVAAVGNRPTIEEPGPVHTMPPAEMEVTPEPEPLFPFTEDDINRMAKTVWAEARGVRTTKEQAAVVWCILNRLDSYRWPNTIAEVVIPVQFAYHEDAPVTEDLYDLCMDVCLRWWAEQNGAKDVGRVLPADYFFFEGDGLANHFRKTWEKTGEEWDWSLPDPYAEG